MPTARNTARPRPRAAPAGPADIRSRHESGSTASGPRAVRGPARGPAQPKTRWRADRAGRGRRTSQYNILMFQAALLALVMQAAAPAAQQPVQRLDVPFTQFTLPN